MNPRRPTLGYAAGPRPLPYGTGPAADIDPNMPPPGLDPAMANAPPLPAGGQPGKPGAPGGPAAGAAQNITPGMMEAMVKMHGQPAKQGTIDRQRKLADMMRTSAADQMKGMMVGDHYVAPGALQLGGSVLQSYLAARQDQQTDAAAKQLGLDQADQSRQTIEALTGKQLPVPPPPNPNVAGAEGGGDGMSAMLDFFKKRFGGGG